MTMRGNGTKREISDSIGIIEQKPDHHYRTEIPNLIFEILNGDELLVYCFLKRIAGDYGECWMTVKNLSKKIGIGEHKLRGILNNMSLENGYCSSALINIIERYKPDGSRDTNLIEIVDIWRLNGDYFRNLRNKRSCPPPYDSVTTPLTESEPPPLRKRKGNEDLSQEDLSKEQQREVVVPAAQENFCKSDVHRIGMPKGWTSEEIDKAWKVYDRNRHIVSSPIDYIEGIIEKTRIITQSKKSKEQPCSTIPTTPMSEPQETLQERRARVKQEFLANVTETNILETYMQQEREKSKPRLCPS